MKEWQRVDDADRLLVMRRGQATDTSHRHTRAVWVPQHSRCSAKALRDGGRPLAKGYADRHDWPTAGDESVGCCYGHILPGSSILTWPAQVSASAKMLQRLIKAGSDVSNGNIPPSIHYFAEEGDSSGAREATILCICCYGNGDLWAMDMGYER